MAIEIVDLPIKNGDFPIAMLVHQMLNQVLRYVRKFNFSGPEACQSREMPGMKLAETVVPSPMTAWYEDANMM